MKFIFIKFASFLICILSTACFLLEFNNCIKSIQSNRWSKVTGVLGNSEVTKFSQIRKGDEYTIKASYKYIIDGETHISNQIQLGGFSTMDKNLAFKKNDEIKNQKPLIVYVNKNNHKESVLFKGWDNCKVSRLILYAIISIFTGLIGFKLRRIRPIEKQINQR